MLVANDPRALGPSRAGTKADSSPRAGPESWFSWALLGLAFAACGGGADETLDGGALFRDAHGPLDAATVDAMSTDGHTTAVDAAPDAGPVVPRLQPGRAWQIQYSGPLDLSVDVDVFDLDLFDTPEATIRDIEDRGVFVICYFSAGSYEDWRPDAEDFPQDAIGKPLDNWPGEYWLDIRSSAVFDIMVQRMELARTKVCDAVDPDNVDGYANDTGFPLTYQDQLAYNRRLAQQAHRLGLAIGLKNDLDQIPDLADLFDFAVNEECFDYDECDALVPFIARTKAVFQIQYDESQFDEICPRAEALGLDTLFKHMELDAWRRPCSGR